MGRPSAFRHLTKQDLQTVIVGAKSNKEILLKLGITYSGDRLAKLRKIAEDWEIEMPEYRKPPKDSLAWCAMHKQWLPVDNFTPRKSRKRGTMAYCRECYREYNSLRYDSESRRWSGIYKHYQLSKEDYETLLEYQDGVCGLCFQPPKKEEWLHVDHDHSCCTGPKTCGKCIRGLLCSHCNRKLGWYERRKELIHEYTSRRRVY